MKITHFCIMLLGSGVLTAVFVTNFSKLISVTTDLSNSDYYPTNDRINPFSNLKIADSPNNLFWFLQVSDLHISNFQDESRITNLRQFCDSTVSIIEPSLVLASGEFLTKLLTLVAADHNLEDLRVFKGVYLCSRLCREGCKYENGDLTDAKEPDNVGSRQILEEWKIYKDILVNCKSLKNVKWLDIRGNHDNFDVPGSGSTKNLYQNYSNVGGRGHSFSHSVTTEDGRIYTFIGLDACPEQGLRRPFNFVGLLRENEISFLKSIVSSNSKTDYFIWFGHYPTSCILSHQDQVREIISEDRRSIVYLCGHLHTLGGLVPKMYTLQKRGFLELELADWKDNRMYRLLAIDHGLLSFIDVRFEEWPVILVTNPKGPIFASDREPYQNIASSDYIRVLVFSPGKVLHVGVSLNENEWLPCRHVKGPLFVLPWHPSGYLSGLHTIKVSAVDELGNQKTLVHQFSLDGTQYSYGLLARICLMTNISSVSQLLFGMMIVGCTLPLCFLKYIKRRSTKDSNGSKELFPHLRPSFVRDWIRRLWILSNIDKFFYPIIGYPLYLTIGPWFVGELMRDHLGVIFVWGTFINNSFLPGAFTYTFAFKQLLLFHLLFVAVTAYILDYRISGNGNPRIYALVHTCMMILVVSQIYLLYYFWLAYGTTTVIFGPFRTYPVILFIYTWFQSASIPLVDIRNALHPWIKES